MSRKLRYIALNLALFFALGVLFERPAHAYADPGSALLVFQSLSACVTAGLFYFRRRLKSMLTRNRPAAGKLESSN
jgi:hypothetical protein